MFGFIKQKKSTWRVHSFQVHSLNLGNLPHQNLPHQSKTPQISFITKMAPNTPKNLYYTVPLDDDDLESQDYYIQEKTPRAPWFSVPVRSDAVAISPRSSPLSALKEKLWSSWSNDNDNHHLGNTHSDGSTHGGRGFWDRWIWLVHAVLLTISMTLFALSMCALQTAAATTNAAAVQCQGSQVPEGSGSNFGK